MNVLNQPSEETFERVAKSLEVLSETKPQDDYSNAPGNKHLTAGNRDAGFFGYVSSDEFINGETLATEIGLTAGTSMFNNVTWIKYIKDGRVRFVPVKPLRRSIAWNAIYNAGAVYGTGDEGTLPPNGRIGTQLSISSSDNSINGADFETASAVVASVGDTVVLKGWKKEANNGEFEVTSITDTKIVLSGGDLEDESDNKLGRIYPKANAVTQDAKVTINGLEYRVALMEGGASDPLDSYADSDRGSLGDKNEWNAIILPMHERAKLQNWNYPAYAGTTEDFGTYLTDEDLRTHHTFGYGNYTWCQEVRDDSETYRRAARGYYGASYLVASSSWYASTYYGWRPRLELLG